MSGQAEDYSELLKHIAQQWSRLRVLIEEDTATHYGLPNPFIAPSVDRQEGFVFKEQFYWDSYFTIVGLIHAGDRDLAMGMIDNLLYMLRKFGYVPNSNKKDHLGRSQPPFLSSMILAGHKINKDDAWLGNALELLEQEYQLVWRSHDEKNDREVEDGLSRYFHQDGSHKGAEDESGWDYTSRFDSRAQDFIPVDLNSLLFKYENDIALINERLEHAAPDWYRLAELRKQSMDELLWNEEKGIFFDYDFKNQRQSEVASLAAFYPLFVGLADRKQAEAIVSNLELFETDHGVMVTSKDDPPNDDLQWANPNGWAPAHFIVVEGLRRYGYQDEAKRIAQKWVDTVNSVFEQTGKIQEKYNMVDPMQNPSPGMYPDQFGFAWTNAITLHFIRNYLQ